MAADPQGRKRDAPHPADSEPPRWLDSPRNVDRVVYAVYAISALLLVIDPLVYRHGPFGLERWWGFYGIYGFVGCVFLVLAAKLLRKLVMRPEDYYDR